MTTIAEKLVLLSGTKGAIRNAIEAKGVPVPVETPFAVYPDKIAAISSGGAAEIWTPPVDWIDISTVNDNEINLLVNEGTGIAFSVVTASGTYSIDWGDGTVEIDRVSGTIYQHQHLIGGTPCTLGYNTWKIRIYGATADITRWKVERHSYTSRPQYVPILWMVFGTLRIISYSEMLGATSKLLCKVLQACYIPSFEMCTTTYCMFYRCTSLVYVSLPSSWGSISNASYMFYLCSALTSVVLPSDWGNVLNLESLFAACYMLSSVTLPDNWGIVTNITGMLNSCKALSSIILPLSWGTVQTATALFAYSLLISSVTLPDNWGSVTNIASMFNSCEALSDIVLPSSWGNIQTVSSLFSSCLKLVSVTLPNNWGMVTNIDYMFQRSDSIVSITFPDSWGNISSANYVFYQCGNISKVFLPLSLGKVASAVMMFYLCYSLKTVNGVEFLGSNTIQSSLDYVLMDCEFIQQNIVIGSLLKKIGINGSSGFLLKTNSIRLSNPGSLFAGTSPHVDVSYTSMAAAALNLLFGDLPTLSGKTINITGCPGAATCTRSIATAKGWAVTG